VEKWAQAIRLIGIGFYIGICIVVGVLGGNWLDQKFNARPIFLLVGVVLALILIFWGVYQMLLPLISDKRDKKERR
jgi:F0F1-type ATP synthase assembly protein I